MRPNLRRQTVPERISGKLVLVRADFRHAVVDSANLFGTIRESWQIAQITCNSCWITRDRLHFSNEPDTFAEGEFELRFGGRRIQVRFPGGMQPIDLAALPFYSKAILDRYKGKRIVFTGLSTVGEACLEFRVEDDESNDEETALQEHMNSVTPSIRGGSELLLREMLRMREQQVVQQNKILDVLSTLVLQDRHPIGRSDITFLVAGDLHITWNNIARSMNPEALRSELLQLKEALGEDCKTDEAENVAAAERAIESGNGERAVEFLKKAGSWALQTATKIGTDLATNALKQALGLG
jgi:hypothetical protein